MPAEVKVADEMVANERTGASMPGASTRVCCFSLGGVRGGLSVSGACLQREACSDWTRLGPTRKGMGRQA